MHNIPLKDPQIFKLYAQKYNFHGNLFWLLVEKIDKYLSQHRLLIIVMTKQNGLQTKV